MKFNKKNTLELIEKYISIESVSMKTNLRQVHIAILIKRGKILDIASNFVGSRNSGCGYDNRTIHAERAVLKKVGDTNKLAGATLIVIRIAKGTKELVNSEPCHSCQCHLEKCIKEYGLKQVYYSP
jgi:deoxycytidylate deaminase